MIKFIGLKNCDTCRKAKKWLEAEGFDFHYQDVRQDGLSKDDVTTLVGAVGWESLLNRRGTTWRGLSDSDKADVDEKKAVELMVAHPALMKRPVFVQDDTVIVGFKQAEIDALKSLK